MTKRMLTDMFEWFDQENGEVAIFIPWVTTHHLQKRIVSRCHQEVNRGKKKVEVLFVENICDDPSILMENMKVKLKYAPEWKDRPLKESMQSLQTQIVKYQTKFDTINDDSFSYVKIINLRSKVICNGIFGHLPSVITTFLMSIHIGIRPVWLTTPAQFTHTDGQLSATDDGEKFRRQLPLFLQKRLPNNSDLIVFTAPDKTSSKTVEYLPWTHKIETPVLNLLSAGVCTGMSKADIANKMPEVWQKWRKDPYHFRFPSGESYEDLVYRLDPFILQLERFTVPVLVVVHDTVLQVLYSYFKNQDVTQSPLLHLPKHTIIELASARTGWTEKSFPLAKAEENI
uniref:6-phosphofructo-2-kinase domain-containing protein n=1 Tax=Arcella intermedia TaxID=1963864 RepID=A0A6B2L905_9EUKA